MRDGVGGRDRSGGVPSGRPAGGLQSGRGLWLSAGAQWVTSPPPAAASSASARRPSRLCGVRPHERGPSPRGQGLVPGGDGQPADGRGPWGETEGGEAPPGSGAGFGGRRRWPVGAREARDLVVRRGAEGDGQEGNAGGGTVAQPRRSPVGVRSGWGTGATGTEVSGAARRRRGVRPRAGRGTVRDAEGRAGIEAGRRSRSSKRKKERKKKEKEKHIMARPHGRTDACTSTGGWTERSVGLYCRIWLADMSGQQPRIPKPSRTLR
jgi:hypothetical protein